MPQYAPGLLRFQFQNQRPWAHAVVPRYPLDGRVWDEALSLIRFEAAANWLLLGTNLDHPANLRSTLDQVDTNVFNQLLLQGRFEGAQ